MPARRFPLGIERPEVGEHHASTSYPDPPALSALHEVHPADRPHANSSTKSLGTKLDMQQNAHIPHKKLSLSQIRQQLASLLSSSSRDIPILHPGHCRRFRTAGRSSAAVKQLPLSYNAVRRRFSCSFPPVIIAGREVRRAAKIYLG